MKILTWEEKNRRFSRVHVESQWPIANLATVAASDARDKMPTKKKATKWRRPRHHTTTSWFKAQPRPSTHRPPTDRLSKDAIPTRAHIDAFSFPFPDSQLVIKGGPRKIKKQYLCIPLISFTFPVSTDLILVVEWSQERSTRVPHTHFSSIQVSSQYYCLCSLI